MAYARHTWLNRIGVGLNKFHNSGTATDLILTANPDSVSQEGTPFSAAWMNELEAGVEAAYPRVTSATLPTGWTQVGATDEYTQPVTITGLADGDKVDIQPDAAVMAQLQADNVSALWIVNTNGIAAAHAYGGAPTAGITIQITLTEVVV